MSVATAATEPTEPSGANADPVDEPDRVGDGPAWRAHLIVAVLATAMGVWVTSGLWADPRGRALLENVSDQAFFEWLLGYGRYVLSHGANPFFADVMNAPNGVNLAANTSITVYIVLFAPLTILAGPQLSYVTILTLNLAASAFGWYFFLQRHLVRHRLAAAVGGLFAGFAPGFISHANGHLNWTAGWIAPLVLWWVLKLREPGRWLRNGAVLGALLAVGFSIAAEGLFFTALASGVFVVSWSLAKATRAEARAAAPTVLKALGVAAGLGGALLAYPLYMHFAGPQSFSGTGFNQRHFVEDAAAYVGFATQSLAGWLGLDSGSLDSNPTEQTSFFGVPLLVFLVFTVGAVWSGSTPGRRATLRALFLVGGLFLLLSLGPRLRFLKTEYDIPLLYAPLTHVPLFDSALPARYALVVVCVVAILLALVADRMLTRSRQAAMPARVIGLAGFTVALLPLFPIALPTVPRSPEPHFISAGTWKQYVSPGGSITSLPFAVSGAADTQRWQSYTMARGGQQFNIPGGYFLGPGGPEGKGRLGAPLRRTDWLFLRVAFYGYTPQLGDYDRAQARADFQYWNLQAIFLPATVTGTRGALLYRSALETTATKLLGPPQRVDDVLLWTIRPGIDPVGVIQPG